jgi:hypothetical protein
VSASIKNVGTSAQLQSVKLFAGDLRQDSQLVALDAGAEESIALQWITDSGDIGYYTLSVLDSTTSVHVAAP